VPPLKRVRAVSDMVYSIRLTDRSLRENRVLKAVATASGASVMEQ